MMFRKVVQEVHDCLAAASAEGMWEICNDPNFDMDPATALERLKDIINRRIYWALPEMLALALASIPSMSDSAWQSIDTAKRDGKQILAVSMGTCISPCYWILYWHKEYDCWSTFEGKQPNPAPTHWQPLQSPPEQTGEGRDAEASV